MFDYEHIAYIAMDIVDSKSSRIFHSELDVGYDPKITESLMSLSSRWKSNKNRIYLAMIDIRRSKPRNSRAVMQRLPYWNNIWERYIPTRNDSKEAASFGLTSLAETPPLSVSIP